MIHQAVVLKTEIDDHLLFLILPQRTVVAGDFAVFKVILKVMECI